MGNTTPKSEKTVDEREWPWIWALWDGECLDWKQGLSDEEIRATGSGQTRLPVPITDNLFLADAVSVESIERLKERGITAVLNMAGPHALQPKTIRAYQNSGIRYKQIDAKDEVDYPLIERDWKEASEFIRSVTQNGTGKCVVHCRAGMNRSVLVVAAYFMVSTRSNVLESVQHVRRQRGNAALCNQGFQRQLVALARTHDLLGPAPGTEGCVVAHAAPPFSIGLSILLDE